MAFQKEDASGGMVSDHAMLPPQPLAEPRGRTPPAEARASVRLSISESVSIDVSQLQESSSTSGPGLPTRMPSKGAAAEEGAGGREQASDTFEDYISVTSVTDVGTRSMGLPVSAPRKRRTAKRPGDPADPVEGSIHGSFLTQTGSAIFRKTRRTAKRKQEADDAAASRAAEGAAMPLYKQRINAFLDSWWANAIIACMIVWALLGTDIRYAATSYVADPVFNAITITLLLGFVGEWMLQVVARPGYINSFFFYLDIISALSLLFDIPEVLAYATGNTISTNTSTATRAARASQLGTRAARILGLTYMPAWVLRLMQRMTGRGGATVARIGRTNSVIPSTPVGAVAAGGRRSSTDEPAPAQPRRSLDGPLGDATGGSVTLSPAGSTLATVLGGAGGVGSSAPRMQRTRTSIRLDSLMDRSLTRRNGLGGSVPDAADPSSLRGVVHSETRVGSHLSRLITVRVILLVLVLLFILPLFTLSFWVGRPGTEPNETLLGGLEMLHVLYTTGGGSKGPYAQLQALYLTSAAAGTPVGGTVFSLVVNGTVMLDGSGYTPLRTREQVNAAFASSYVSIDIRPQSRLTAICNLCRNIFIILILGGGALLFAKDANDLVLEPIERLVRLMRQMADNPLFRHDEEELEPDEQYETGALRQLFRKMVGLLQLGFGEAGARVIADNLRGGGALRPMVPGKRVVAIFGFCDIRQFTETTEVLQEDVMEFVNSIARIVHTEVTLHGGSANKNMGDAFLLVWKFPDHIDLEDVEDVIAGRDTAGAGAGAGGGSMNNAPTPHAAQRQAAEALSASERHRSFETLSLLEAIADDRENRLEVNAVADQALAAFVAIIAGIKKSASVQAYRSNPQLNERMPDFNVAMGFGLHVGWAIEGAIGSVHKVDASYLSPNVNMASRLEAATKQYGVPLLLSSEFASILSPSVRARCRQIDRVTVKGSSQAVGLFTLDCELTGVSYGGPQDRDEPGFESRNEFEDEFAEHPDIMAIAGPGRAVTPAFLERFAEGFQAYRSGDWVRARDRLIECEHERRTLDGVVVRDGPCSTLLAFMRESNFVAPPTWRGYRELLEK